MIEDSEVTRRRPRAPRQQRRRRRWEIVAAVVASWVVLEVLAGSAVSATVLLVVLAGLGAASVGGLRVLGITRDHPWVRRLASRPWRDGQDVLRIAMLHLSEVFVVTPSGSLLAPKAVELQLNPGDLGTLCERMELGVIRASLAEVYEEQAAAYGARLAGSGRAEVQVVASASVPPGRYCLRQEDPVRAAAGPGWPDAWYADVAGREHDPGSTVARSVVTVMAPGHLVPVLRLITGSSVAETVVSGARAGRGPVELVLPDVPTVSREHAIFTFSDGRWWIANQGRNGLTLNGTPVAGRQPLGDGDAIRWGTRQDALLSRVEIS